MGVLELTLDVESSLAIVRATHGFVDLYKVGRANYLPMTKTTDWRDYTRRMVDLLQHLGTLTTSSEISSHTCRTDTTILCGRFNIIDL